MELATVQTMKPDEIKLANQKDGALSIRALNEEKTYSALLEELDPSEGYRDPKTFALPALDAFGRQCAVNGIVTRSDPQAGIYTSTWGDFLKADRGLALEWVFRKVREAQYGRRTPDLKLDAYTS